MSDAEIREARLVFAQQLPTATSGLSIVERLAAAASNVNNKNNPSNVTVGAVPNMSRGVKTTVKQRAALSQRVVNSHLQYFLKFAPFSEGRFTKDTLYQFLFFAVVENRVRMSYAKRVLRNLLSYVRRYLDINGGDSVSVHIEKANGSSNTVDIKLTPESISFLRDNQRGIVVQSKLFYRLMNSIGDQTGNQRLKNVVCEARRPRDLVFNEEQNAMLLLFVFRTLRMFVLKYVKRTAGRQDNLFRILPGMTAITSRDIRIQETIDSIFNSGLAIKADPGELRADRALFEFCVAHLFGFLTGARIKSTIMRLTVAETDRLIRGETIEKLTKGSFVRVFIPEPLRYNNSTTSVHCAQYSSEAERMFDPRDHRLVAVLLYNITMVRRDPLLYGVDRVCSEEGGNGAFHKYGDDRFAQLGRNNRVKCPFDMSRSTSNPQIDIQQLFFLSGGRQIDYTFNKIYQKLFLQKRPKGVLWHSQRRRYLGAVNEKFGAVTASKSVGHNDVETTMLYINNSMHRDDTNRRAGSAVYDEMIRLVVG